MFIKPTSILITSFLLLPNLVTAEPTSGLLHIRNIRTYTDGSIIVQVDSQSLCDTDVFTYPGNLPARQQFTAILLTAQSLEKPITIEAAGCTGWGTRIQSLFSQG